ncbi:MAG: hypothetical protein IKW87_02870 [Ruminococcus sp.]|nr:hypothetical protein [Ruminococcus sp.]
MAIVRFQQPSGSTSLANFCEWLNEHKEGTFLEDLTVTNTTTVNTNDTLSIADDDVTIKFTVQSGSNKELFRYSSDDFTKVLKTTNGTEVTAYIVGALLCDNGLMLQYYAGYNSSTWRDNYGVCITVDSNGQLAALTVTSVIPESTTEISVWDTCTAQSTTTARRNCRPYYGASMTALAQITAQGIDNTLRLPDAYAAITTQLSAEALNSVLIDGALYITNGVWYIRDSVQ